MKKILIACATIALAGCTPALLGGLTGAPPQAPAAVTNISRTAIDFALHSFDAALYGLDAAMDAGKLVPGSPTAKKIAAAGRKVLSFLGVADAAQRLGSQTTYEEAFKNANVALDEFRSLWASPAAAADQPALTWEQRFQILDRLVQDRPTMV